MPNTCGTRDVRKCAITVVTIEGIGVALMTLSTLCKRTGDIDNVEVDVPVVVYIGKACAGAHVFWE